MIGSPAAGSYIPLADPIPLAAPWGLFRVLLILTFCLHLVAMNLVLGGSLIGLAGRILGRKEMMYSARLSLDISRILPISIAAAVSFGIAPLLFLQVLYGRLFYTSSILMGWYWWGIVPLLISAYYGAYLLAFRSGLVGRWETFFKVFTVLSFGTIAFLFVNNMTLMLRPSLFRSMYWIDSGGWSLNLSDPALLPRYLHLLMGALAVSGLAMVLGGIVLRRQDRFYGSWLVRNGLRWFLGATAVNFLIGTWLLLSFPKEFLLGFVQKGVPGPAILATAITIGFVTFGLAVLAVQNRNRNGLLIATILCTLLTVVSMVLVRDQVRETMLSMAGFQPVGWVDSQWGAIVLFSLLLLIAMSVVIWMVCKLVSVEPQL